jgi:hypothetical protein
MGDSGTKLYVSKCKLNVLFQCISCAAGTLIADQCDFVCSGTVLRGSSSSSSFNITDSNFILGTESSLGISSSHGHKTSVSGCNFVNGMCGIMIDSDAICNVTKSKFSECKFGCRCRDAEIELSRCNMLDCQKCLHSFGPKGNIQAKDCKFEKITLNCMECTSESSIYLERCAVENSAVCAIKSTAKSKISMVDCVFMNCNTKVIVGTGGSIIKIVGCSFKSMSGNGFDFSDNVNVSMENVMFHVCSGIGIQLSRSKLQMTSCQISSVLSHCILMKQESSLAANECSFEFFNGKMIAIEDTKGCTTDGDANDLSHQIELQACKKL